VPDRSKLSASRPHGGTLPAEVRGGPERGWDQHGRRTTSPLLHST